MIPKINKLLHDRQLWAYGLIGITGAALDFILYIVFYKSMHIPPAIASFLSVSAGIVNNFILNSRHNFKVSDAMLARFVNFYVIGLGGAILSTILIILFYNRLRIDPTLSKLLTIPPVVLLQFFLNRKFSFGIRSNSSHKLALAFRNFWPLLLINLIFVISCLAFIKTLPTTAPLGGPDESIHYGYNVKFMLDKHKLPISGKDDVNLYKTCRDNQIGSVPCIYSYQVFPPANYIVSAVVAWFAHISANVSYLKGARLASMAEGLIFVNFTYFTVLAITRKKGVASIITATVALIPQVIFCSSYVNQDAWSLAIGSFVTFALVKFVLKPTHGRAILVALALGGLLPLAKYNYFIYLLPALVTIIYMVHRRLITNTFMLRLFAYTLGFFLPLSAGWYIRNFVLYHDLLGQGFVLRTMEHYHALGNRLSVSSPSTLVSFVQYGFFIDLFNSFFAYLGFMNVRLNAYVYENLRLLYLGVVVGCALIFSTISSREKRTSMAILLTFGVMLLLCVGQVYFNSAAYDFQPQGRYAFGVLSMSVVAFASLYKTSAKFLYILVALLFGTIYMYISAIDLFIRTYL